MEEMADVTSMRRFMVLSLPLWIPAFAGMTVVLGSRKAEYHPRGMVT